MILLQALPDPEKYIDKTWNLGPEPVYGVLIIFAWVVLAGVVYAWLKEQKTTARLRDEKEVLLKESGVNHSLDANFERVENRLREAGQSIQTLDSDVRGMRAEMQTTINLVQQAIIRSTHP